MKAKKRPLRSALKADSSLLPHVNEGLAALRRADIRLHVDEDIRTTFSDSLDLDAAMQAGHDRENRWDYLLGHEPSLAVIGLEPHSAREDQISTIIAKRKAALDQLRGHLRPGQHVAAWLWVASGSVDFADTEKARFRLDQSGIRFIGRKLLKKHLPVPPEGKSSKAR